MKTTKTTRELFEEYFKDKSPETVRKTRAQIDRPEVYAYEIKIGKRLVDMEIDELFEMILSFDDNRKKEKGTSSISYNSYSQIASMYRSFFHFYIDNYEVKKNPFENKKMKGKAAIERLAQFKESYTWEMVENVIQAVHNEYEENKAKYIECIILLYYNGFSKAEEIVNFTEDMIDFENKTVTLDDRIIQLSARCFELLQFVHNLKLLEGPRENFLVVPWRDKYFKHIIRQNEKESFNDRTIDEVADVINRRISVNVKRKFGVDINYRTLYLLGFYDYIVSKKGKERAKELVLSIRDSEDIEELFTLARDYGVVTKNTTYLKKLLRPFI